MDDLWDCDSRRKCLTLTIFSHIAHDFLSRWVGPVVRPLCLNKLVNDFLAFIFSRTKKASNIQTRTNLCAAEDTAQHDYKMLCLFLLCHINTLKCSVVSCTTE